MKSNKKKIISMLKQILKVESVELKNYSIESLIDMLEDLEINETTDRERSQSNSY